MKDIDTWIQMLAITLVFIIIMLVISGCVSNDGCTVETNRKWTCPADGSVTVIVPGTG